jgi:hypothetical protein
MIGCVAGEAHLDDGSEVMRAASTELLAAEIVGHARTLGGRALRSMSGRPRKSLPFSHNRSKT